MLEISIWPMVCECSSGSMFWRTTALMSWANSGLYHGVDFINEHIFPFGYDCIISNQCQVFVYFFMLMSRKDGVFSRATFDKNGALMFNWQSIIQNSQIFVTIIGAVVGGIAVVSGIPKIYLETLLARRNRGREEYRFAKELLNDLHGEKALHPFLREKGCQAITGNKNAN